MAYSTNPNLPRARAFALRLLLLEAVPLQVVANRCGVHRSTVYRWQKKWRAVNSTQQLSNHNRPQRAPGNRFRLLSCTWLIPTLSSRPHTSPGAVCHEIVARILELRAQLKRCAEVVWHYLRKDGIRISLSSVRRILRRHYLVEGRKKRVRSDNPRRPHVSQPGELVQTDTIHYICPLTKRRRYVYTVIDLYTRMTYAEVQSRILPGLAANAVLHASQTFGFAFAMVQADNGPEFATWLKDMLKSKGTLLRHSRVRQSNDNAHVERFNRTIQQELLGTKPLRRNVTQSLLDERLHYYNHDRLHLGIELQTPISVATKQPA